MCTMIFRLLAVCLMAITLTEANYQYTARPIYHPQKYTHPCNNRRINTYFNRHCNSSPQYKLKLSLEHCNNMIAYCQTESFNQKLNSYCQLIERVCSSITIPRKLVVEPKPEPIATPKPEPITTEKPEPIVAENPESPKIGNRVAEFRVSEGEMEIVKRVPYGSSSGDSLVIEHNFLKENEETTPAPDPPVDIKNKHSSCGHGHATGSHETSSEDTRKFEMSRLSATPEVGPVSMTPSPDFESNSGTSVEIIPRNKPDSELEPSPHHAILPVASIPNYDRIIPEYPGGYPSINPCQDENGSPPCQTLCRPTDPCASQFINPYGDNVYPNYTPEWPRYDGYGGNPTYYN